MSVEPIERIEKLLEQAEKLADPAARALARELAAALVDLVGAGLARAIELGGHELERRLADDELVGNLLVLAGTHPDAPAVRAKAALDAASRTLASIGVKLAGFEQLAGTVVVQVVPSERGTVPDEDRVRALIEAIVMSRAPDVDAVRVELSGVVVRQAGFVPLERLRVTT